MTRIDPRTPITALLAALLAGCLGSAPSPVHYYTLEAPGDPAPAAAPAAAGGLTVGVEAFSVDPPYDQDRLVYRHGPTSTEVGFYTQHRWASPLGELVAVALAEGLPGTAGLAAVEPVRAGSSYDAKLTGRVVTLEEVGVAGVPELRLKVTLELRHGSGAELWADTLATSASGPAADAAGVMGLAHRAFADLVARVRSGIGQALQQRATP